MYNLQELFSIRYYVILLLKLHQIPTILFL